MYARDEWKLCDILIHRIFSCVTAYINEDESKHQSVDEQTFRTPKECYGRAIFPTCLRHRQNGVRSVCFNCFFSSRHLLITPSYSSQGRNSHALCNFNVKAISSIWRRQGNHLLSLIHSVHQSHQARSRYRPLLGDVSVWNALLLLRLIFLSDEAGEVDTGTLVSATVIKCWCNEYRRFSRVAIYFASGGVGKLPTNAPPALRWLSSWSQIAQPYVTMWRTTSYIC